MYNYLDKNELEQGNLVVLKQVDKKLKNIDSNMVEVDGDIPNDWYFDGKHVYDLSKRPSPYHDLVNGKWVVVDERGFTKYYLEKLDELKKEFLYDGILFEGNRQSCLEKDMAYLTTTIMSLSLLNDTRKIKWYFKDNTCEEMDVVNLKRLLSYCVGFIQSVQDTEHYFKSIDKPTKLITKEEFRDKQQEIYSYL